MFLKILQISLEKIFAGVSFLTKFQTGNLKRAEAAAGDALRAAAILKNFANLAGKNLCWSLFLIKLEFWGPATLSKKTLAQVFSCEIYKLFQNNYFEEHL